MNFTFSVSTGDDQYEADDMDDKRVDETMHTYASESKYVGRWTDDMIRGQGVRVSVGVAVWVWMCIATTILRMWN
jgi:hypothetical protein